VFYAGFAKRCPGSRDYGTFGRFIHRMSGDEKVHA
jgi:hypothetical protein